MDVHGRLTTTRNVFCKLTTGEYYRGRLQISYLDDNYFCSYIGTSRLELILRSTETFESSALLIRNTTNAQSSYKVQNT